MQHPDDEESIEGFLNARFSRTQHCLPVIVKRIWEARDQAKREHNVPLSHALKIIMNSFYGVLGSYGCRFFDARLASSITMCGHQIMHQTRALIEAMGYEVIYGDTDSTFVWLKQPHSEEDAKQIGEKLVTTVNDWWRQDLKERLNLESALELQFERHFCRFFMPTIRGMEEGSKKRYAGLSCLENGNSTLIFKGLETVRSDWTVLAQDFQQELYRRIFERESYEAYLQDYVQKLLRDELDDRLIYRKRLRRPLKDYQRNVPPHVRAARMADKFNLRNHQPRMGAGSVIS